MQLEIMPADSHGRLEVEKLGALTDACLVLTAGTTATGVVDPLDTAGRAAWAHVDAAWAGPLRLPERYAARVESCMAIADGGKEAKASS